MSKNNFGDEKIVLFDNDLICKEKNCNVLLYEQLKYRKLEIKYNMLLQDLEELNNNNKILIDQYSKIENDLKTVKDYIEYIQDGVYTYKKYLKDIFNKK